MGLILLKLKNMNILGPFEARNRIGLLGLDSESLYLISLDLISMIKYSISIQLPFFGQYFDKLKNQPIDELKRKYSTTEVKYSDLSDIVVKRSNWKNHIIITSENESIKWNILEPHETDNYEKLLNSIRDNVINL